MLILAILVATACPAPAAADAIDRARAAGVLVYGTDTEGGAPFIYPDPDDPARTIGFEVELMDRLARRLGVPARPDQTNWDRLLQVLGTRRIDVAVNGLELTPDRASRFLATRPYLVYQLQLLGLRGSPLRSWDDLRGPKPGGGRWRIGVLTTSVADRYLQEQATFLAGIAGATTVEVVRRDSVADALREVNNGQLDATLQDDLAARYYLKQEAYARLRPVGPPQGGGYYVMYVRPEDAALRDALDAGIAALIEGGELRQIYEKYDLWGPAQEELASWQRPTAAHSVADRGWRAILAANGPLLARAAWMTVLLSVCSMPLAMLAGLVVALARMYGPAPLRTLAVGYVELIRGTPLMLQLFVLYFLLPEVGVVLPDVLAGVLGLALNYSAYEAEIYRTGLQAVPPGQMEAALALGMSRPMAVRRVVLPQAFRIVIPPITSDFITLLKDSSVCSAIGLVELSKQYSISVSNSGGHVVLFAVVVAAIYLAMSLPLSRLAHLLERRLDAIPEGGAAR
jgi:polar amino acid transport system substrate-binding protein